MHYKGETLDGIANGKGMLLYPTGVTEYEGSFKNNLLDGRGCLYNSTGTLMYRGDFKKGLKHGVGIEFYTNGQKKFEGQLINDNWYGWGKWYSSDGELKHQGGFSNGKPLKKLVKKETENNLNPAFYMHRDHSYHSIRLKSGSKSRSRSKEDSRKNLHVHLQEEQFVCNKCSKINCTMCQRFQNSDQYFDKNADTYDISMDEIVEPNKNFDRKVDCLNYEAEIQLGEPDNNMISYLDIPVN